VEFKIMDNWKNHTVQEPWKSLSDA